MSTNIGEGEISPKVMIFAGAGAIAGAILGGAALGFPALIASTRRLRPRRRRFGRVFLTRGPSLPAGLPSRGGLGAALANNPVDPML